MENARGAALIEVLVAMVILASAGVSSLAYVTSFVRAQADLEAREAEVERADQLLTVTTLLSRLELDQRLGERPHGEFNVLVGRPEATLYRISVTRSNDPSLEILTTVVYRPEEKRNGP